MPTLQTSGQLCWYLKEHLGNPIPSPALLRPLHDRFVRDVTTFADAGKIPVVQFERGQRKDDIAAEHRARFTKAEGVVFIGVAQERASAYKARKLTGSEQGVLFEFSRQLVFVNHYYFYVQDREWGPGFVKVGTYLPHPVRVCLNGHEWAKQQARQVGLGFASLDNGFLACDDPERLQAICDGLGPADVQRFFDRWSAHLPWPLTLDDRAAGYQHRLSIWQLEVSRTQVFDRPVVALGPDMAAGVGFDQLRGHTNPLVHRLDAAFENIFHVQVAAYLADVGRLALVDLSGIAGDDDEVLGVGEIGNDVLGNSVGKAVPLEIASYVVERQDGDRSLLR